MFDSRVIRGSAHKTIAASSEQRNLQTAQQRVIQKRKLLRAKNAATRPHSPPPVENRQHMDTQTAEFLEELTERPDEFDSETQTHFPLFRPISPLYLPAKVGFDTGTQIEENELFDFDSEVEPILEVLVGKTLEQSMMETLEEEELAALLQHQEEFRRHRMQELLDVQRMEAIEKRRAEEAARRLVQAKARAALQECYDRKLLAKEFAKSYLGGLRSTALHYMKSRGLFSDSVQSKIEAKFFPWLMDYIVREVALDSQVSSALEHDMISSSIQSLQDQHHSEISRLANAESEARHEKYLEELRLQEQANQPPQNEESEMAVDLEDENASPSDDENASPSDNENASPRDNENASPRDNENASPNEKQGEKKDARDSKQEADKKNLGQKKKAVPNFS